MTSKDREVTAEVSIYPQQRHGAESVYSQYRRPYQEEQARRALLGLPKQEIADYIVSQVQTKGFRARRVELDAMFNNGC